MKFSIQTLNTVNNPSSVHGIYPYRGKMSALDANQILSQMPERSVVLDPFCGSGTVVYEGLKYNLNTKGIDANPIAVLLSNGKIHIPEDFCIIKNEIEGLINTAKEEKNVEPVPEYSASLFHPETLQEILKVSKYYNLMSDYVKACFVGSIALSARGCNQYKWTSSTVGKSIEPKRYISFYEKFLAKAKKHFYPIKNTSEIFLADARKANSVIEPNSIDFVLTSPPYFDCLDYTAYYAKIVYEILGMDRLCIKEKLIQDFTNYKEDMKIALRSLFDVVKTGGQVIFIVGDKKVHNKVIVSYVE